MVKTICARNIGNKIASRQPFLGQGSISVDFWVPAGSQNGLRDMPGTLQILRQSWSRLKNRSDRLPGGSREAFGTSPGTPRVPRGTILGRFFNDFWSRLWHAKLQWHSIFCTRISYRILRLGAWLWLGRPMNTWAELIRSLDRYIVFEFQSRPAPLSLFKA